MKKKNTRSGRMRGDYLGDSNANLLGGCDTEGTPMKPACCGEVVTSQALGKEFYFCRGCKSEVSEDYPKPLDVEVNSARVTLPPGYTISNASAPNPNGWYSGAPAPHHAPKAKVPNPTRTMVSQVQDLAAHYYDAMGVDELDIRPEEYRSLVMELRLPGFPLDVSLSVNVTGQVGAHLVTFTIRPNYGGYLVPIDQRLGAYTP